MRIDWAVGGDLGEALRLVDTEPESIEIITDAKYVNAIHDAVKIFGPGQVAVLEEKLSRCNS